MGLLRAGKRVSYETALCRYDSSCPTRVGFGVFPAPFALVAAAFAGSWACGRCACARGAWGQGSGGMGDRARGWCQGAGEVDSAGGGAGHAGAGGGGGPPSCALRTGFDRLRANGEGSKRACDVGWWGRAAARRTSGYRLSPVRRWRVWEVGEAETAPHRAPALDTGFRRYDGGGSAGRAWAGGCGGPFDRLRANGIAHRPAPVGSGTVSGSGQAFLGIDGWGCAGHAGLVVAEGPSTDSGRTESRIAPPLLVRAQYRGTGRAFLENGGGGVRDTRGLVVAEGPSTDSVRTESRIAPPLLVRALYRGTGRAFLENGGGGVRDTRGLVVAEGPSTGSGRTESRIAPTVFVGSMRVMGNGLG